MGLAYLATFTYKFKPFMGVNIRTSPMDPIGNGEKSMNFFGVFFQTLAIFTLLAAPTLFDFLVGNLGRWTDVSKDM